MSQAQGRKSNSVMSNGNPQMPLSGVFVFICSLHFNVFCVVKIEFKTQNKTSHVNFCEKKAATLAWIYQLLNLFEHK